MRALVLIATLAAVLLVVLSPGSAGAAPAGQTSPVCSTDAQCAAWDVAHAGSLAAQGELEEDDPRWDCRIHGNALCGVGAVGGPVLEPASDGGESYTCPDLSELVATPVGTAACLWSRAL